MTPSGRAGARSVPPAPHGAGAPTRKVNPLSRLTLAVLAVPAALILPVAVPAVAAAAPAAHAVAAAPALTAAERARLHRLHVLHLRTLHLLHLRTLANLRAAKAAGSQRARVVKAARSALGRPYVYGADGPRSFDCSGLTQWAYKAAGKRLPRTTAEQARAGHAVTRARPGDILVYSDSSGPYHVALVTRVNSAGRVLMTEVARHTGTLISYQAPYQAYTVRAILT